MIRQSHLDWIIMRPPMLTIGTRTGVYRSGEHLKANSVIPKISRADLADFMVWLTNCYFSSHRACNVATSFRRLYWWSLILKAFATDSIFGRDRTISCPMVPCGINRCPPTPFDIKRLHQNACHLMHAEPGKSARRLALRCFCVVRPGMMGSDGT